MANNLVDKADMKILYHLDLDARQPCSKIAKSLGMSVDAVQYRVSKMQRDGVIKGFYAVVDPSALGFISCRFFLKFRRSTQRIEDGIISYFVKHPQYWWACSIDGFRDLGVACWLGSTEEFAKKKVELKEKFGKNLSIVQESIYSEFHQYSRAYLAGKELDTAAPVSLCQAKNMGTDGLDWKILGIVGNNARLSSIEIARQTGTTPATAINRLKSLKQRGIIKRFRPMLDLGRLGYYWYKIEFMLHDSGIKKQMLDFFRSHPNIVYAYGAIGGADLEVELEVKSYEKFRDVLGEIKEKFGDKIESYQHLLWYKEHKITYVPYRA